MSTKRQRLTDAELEVRLRELDGWTLAGSQLYREFSFIDFVGAFGFMSAIALVAQRLDHHPDWSNVYNVVRIHLSTHDADGITELDMKMAAQIDRLYTEGFARP
jgi:4a-hydroxytetrahydrobiopterin dehydratase